MKHLIPYRIQEHYLAQRVQGSLTAYTLFVDLKGFTPLTEGLMREGHQGAERLSTLLNEIFEPLVRLVYARGGFIPYFAGDAFTAIFPADDERQTAEGLVQTAAMARALFERRKNRFGNFTIGLKFGLSYGQVDWGIVGKKDKSFYYGGEPIENCAFCQTLAEVQDIVIDGSLLRQLSNDQLQLEPVGEDAYRVSSTIPVSDFPPSMECDDLLAEVAAAFLPEAIVNYKQEGEFRPVVSIFIGFENVDDHEQLDLFADIILQKTISFSGYFKEIDFGDKGGVITLFFGAPVAFENNIKRALEFILSLQEALATAVEKHDWRLRTGMTIGTAYTGIVGGEERCQYACVGNRVNLASRLMTKADWGEILVDEEIQQQTAFRFLHTGNIKYKGIKGNVPTYKLLGRNFNAEPAYTGKIIARDDELAKALDFSQLLVEKNQGGVAYVFGEAGVGKSRFTYEWRQALANQHEVQWFVCQADQILHKPFNPFLYFLRNYFEQSPEEAELTNRANFQARFNSLITSLHGLASEQASATARELERTRAVLAALLELQDQHSLWEQLDAKGRYQNTIWAIINLLLAESLLRPLVVEMEDAQWLDDSSVELLRELERAAADFPMLLLVVARYSDDGTKTYPLAPRETAPRSIAFLEIELENLPDEAVRTFSERKLGGTITDGFLALLLRTTNSNPFYLEQMLEYFAESGLVTRTETGELLIEDENVKLSNSINAILTARIDRLSDQVKETVKTAAVIGREFEVPILSEVMRSHGLFANRNNEGGTLLKQEIKTAEQVQIWMAMNELRYIFKHSLLREAVYSMQLGTRLKQLHRRVAEAIENLYAWQLESRYVDLAFHYEHAGVFDKTCEYLRKAAEYARANYQNQLALEYYEKLLHYLGAQADSADEIRTHFRRGKLLEVVGNWEESELSFHKALELAKSSRDVVMIGEANNRLGHLLLLKGDYTEAVQYLRRAAGLFQSIDNQEGYVQVNGDLGNLHLRQGEYAEAIECFEQCIASGKLTHANIESAQLVANLALTYMNIGQGHRGIKAIVERLALHRKQNDKQGLAHLLVNLGIVQYEQGLIADAGKSYREGLELAEELGNKQLLAIALGSYGLVVQAQGQYEEAMRLFRQDLQLTEELGDRQGIAIALGLIGELLKLQGDFYPAIEYMQKNLMLCNELGYRKGTAKAQNTLGDIFFFTNEYERSIDFYSRAIATSRAISHKSVLCASLMEMGLVLTKIRRLSEVPPLIQESIQLARELENQELLMEAMALEIRYLHLNGQTSEALLRLEAAHETYAFSPEQEAEYYYMRYRLLPQDTNARAEALKRFSALYETVPRYIWRMRKEQLEEG